MVHVGEEREGELVFLLELGLFLDGLSGDTENDRTLFAELFVCVAKLARFCRSAGCVCLGVEEQYDVPPFGIGKRELLASVGLELDRRRLVAGFEHDYSTLILVPCCWLRLYGIKSPSQTTQQS